jgi:four helix bundle protein
MQDFRKLIVWNSSIDLCVSIYQLTDTFPSTERWRLANQLRRAAISVSSNIAEGAARGQAGDFSRFLRFALGSLAEIQSQLELAARLGLAGEGLNLDQDIEVLRRRLLRLLRKVTAQRKSAAVPVNPSP